MDLPEYDTDEIMNIIDNTIDSILEIDTLGFSVLQGVTSIAILLIIFKITKTSIEVIGGEDRALSFKKDILPLFYIVFAVSFFGQIFSFIEWTIGLVKSSLDESLSLQGYELGGIERFQEIIEPYRNAINEEIAFSMLDVEYWQNIAYEWAMTIVEVFVWCVSSFDLGIFIIFYTMVKIWLSVLAILAPISLVLSFFSKLKSSFDVWLRNFIQVSLWSIVMLLMLYTSDSLYIALSSYIVGDGTMVSADGGIMASLNSAMWVIVSYTPFLILKIILVFKVPQLVGMAIGGGSGGSGGLFMAAFAPIKVGGKAVSVVGGAATGNPAAIAKGLKK